MFTFYLKGIERRGIIENRKIRRVNVESDLTVEDLLEIWNKQNGICIYTGIELILNRSSKICKDQNNVASVDRIDSSIGYTKDNIQFISRTANLAKNTMSHEQMIEFCEMVRDFWKDK